MGIQIYDPNAEGGYHEATQADIDALRAFANEGENDGCLSVLGAVVVAAGTLLTALAVIAGALPA